MGEDKKPWEQDFQTESTEKKPWEQDFDIDEPVKKKAPTSVSKPLVVKPTSTQKEQSSPYQDPLLKSKSDSSTLKSTDSTSELGSYSYEFAKPKEVGKVVSVSTLGGVASTGETTGKTIPKQRVADEITLKAEMFKQDASTKADELNSLNNEIDLGLKTQQQQYNDLTSKLSVTPKEDPSYNYLVEEINSLADNSNNAINELKNNSEQINKLNNAKFMADQASLIGRNLKEEQDASSLGIFTKSAWNAFAPATIKGIGALTSLTGVVNAPYSFSEEDKKKMTEEAISFYGEEKGLEVANKLNNVINNNKPLQSAGNFIVDLGNQLEMEIPESAKGSVLDGFTFNKALNLAGSGVGSMAAMLLPAGAMGSAGKGAQLATAWGSSSMQTMGGVYDEAKKKGMSDESAAYLSLAIGVPVGAVDAVAGARFFGSKKAASELIDVAIKELGGRTITPVILSEVADKTVKTVLKRKGIDILSEATTGAVQQVIEETGKAGYDKMSGTNTFDVTLDSALKNTFDSAFGEAFGAFSVGLLDWKGNVTESAYKQAVSVNKDAASRDYFRKMLSTSVKNGVITQENADNIKANINAIIVADQKIPSNITDLDRRMSAIELIKEKQALEKEIEGKEKALVTKQEERIDAIDSKLNAIALESSPVKMERRELGQKVVPPTVEQTVTDAKASEPSVSNKEIERIKFNKRLGQEITPEEQAILDEYDSKNKSGIPSEVGGGETVIQTKPVQEQSEKTPEASGVVQTQGEVQPVKERVKTISTNSTQRVATIKSAPLEEETGVTLNLDGTEYNEGGVVIPIVSENITQEELTPERIQAFVEKHSNKIPEGSTVKPGIYKFPNSNQVSLDLNIVVTKENQAAAVEFAKKAGQESVFDLDTMENIKTGSDGKNPKQFTDEEFFEIADSLSKGKAPKSTNEAREQFIADGIESLKTMEDAQYDPANDKVYRKYFGDRFDYKNEKGISKEESTLREKVLTSADNIIKALAKIAPKIKIITHTSTDSYKKAMGEEDSKQTRFGGGFYDADANEIHLNLPEIKSNTLFHEGVHPILNAIEAINPETIDKLHDQVVEAEKRLGIEGKYSKEFAGRYKKADQKMEAITEFIADVADGKIEITESNFERVKRFFVDLMAAIGVDISDKVKTINDIKELKNLATKISNAFSTGEEVDGFDGVFVSKRDIQQSKPDKIDIDKVRSQDRPGSKVGRGLIVKTVNKNKVKEETPELSLDYVKKEAPEVYIKNANIIKEYPIVKGRLKSGTVKTVKDADAVYNVFIDSVADNLIWLTESFNQDFKDVATLWYDGANKMANALADKYGVSSEQVSGVIAAMSPQKDWYQNVKLAELVLDTFSKDPVFDSDMVSYQKKINEAGYVEATKKGENQLEAAKKKGEEVVAMLGQFSGKKLSEVPDEVKPYVVRLYNEIQGNKDYDIVRPDGEVVGIARKKDGEKSKLAWGSYSEIGKAVSIMMNGSNKNISESLGTMHKIRNFYNNIIDPMSKDGDVTIDTHAVAAALLLPLSGNSTEVGQNFGTGASSSSAKGIKGIYYAYSDAYAKVAEKLNLLPRQVQSITWEAVRGLFTDSYKSDKKNVQAIQKIWEDFTNKKIDINETRTRISNEAGGIQDPTWAKFILQEPSKISKKESESRGVSGVSRTVVGGKDGSRTGSNTKTGLSGKSGKQLQQPEPVKGDLMAGTPKEKLLTDDGEGNYVFYHYANSDLTKKGIDPNKVGKNIITSKTEKLLAPASFYYTEPNIKEPGVGDFGHVVKVPKNKVYPFNEDPLGLAKIAEERFRKAHPNQAFDANKELAWTSVVAAENGYDVTVASWDGVGGFKNSLRAQSPIKLKPELWQKPKAGAYGQIEVNEDLEYKSNRKKRNIKKQEPASDITPEELEFSIDLLKRLGGNEIKFTKELLKTEAGKDLLQRGIAQEVAKKIGSKPSKSTKSRVEAVDKRLIESEKISDELKAKIEATGTISEEFSNEEAKSIADAYISELGVDGAVEAADTHLKGSVKMFVYGAAIDSISKEIDEAKTPEEKDALAERGDDVSSKMQAKAEEYGRFIQAIGTYYKNSDLIIAKREVNRLKKASQNAFDQMISKRDKVTKVNQSLNYTNKKNINKEALNKIKTPRDAKAKNTELNRLRGVWESLKSKGQKQLSDYTDEQIDVLQRMAIIFYADGKQTFNSLYKELQKETGLSKSDFNELVNAKLPSDISADGMSIVDLANEVNKPLVERVTKKKENESELDKKEPSDIEKILAAGDRKKPGKSQNVPQELYSVYAELNKENKKLMYEDIKNNPKKPEDQLLAEWSAVLNEQQQQEIIDKHFPEKVTEVKAKRKAEHEKIIEAFNSGITNNRGGEKFKELFFDKFGLPKADTEETLKFIGEISKKLAKAPEGSNLWRETYEDLLDYIANNTYQNAIKSGSDKLSAMWYANILSSPATHLRNLQYNAAQALILNPLMIFEKALLKGDFSQLPNIHKGMMEGLKKAIIESGRVFRTGRGTRFDGVIERSLADRKMKFFAPVGRALRGTDIFFSDIAYQLKVREFARAIVKEEHPNWNKEEVDVKVNELVGNTKERKEFASRQAEAELSKFYGADKPKDYETIKKIREFEIIEQTMPENLKDKLEEAKNWAKRSLLTNKPTGLFGVISDMVASMNKNFYVTRFVVPFINVPLNVAQGMIERSPIGLLKAATTNMLHEKMPSKFEYLNPDQQKELALKALNYTIGMVLLIMMNGDDDDEGLVITGKNTGNYTDDQGIIHAGGLRPMTVNYNGIELMSYKTSPLASLLLPAGLMRDFELYGDEKDKTNILSNAAINYLLFINDASAMQGLQGLFGAMADSHFNRLDALKKWAAKQSNALVPYSGAIKFMTNTINSAMNEPDTRPIEMYEYIVKDMPLVQELVGVSTRKDFFGIPVLEKFDIPLIPVGHRALLKEISDISPYYKLAYEKGYIHKLKFMSNDEFTVNGKQVKISKKELDELSADRGSIIVKALNSKNVFKSKLKSDSPKKDMTTMEYLKDLDNETFEKRMDELVEQAGYVARLKKFGIELGLTKNDIKEHLETLKQLRTEFDRKKSAISPKVIKNIKALKDYKEKNLEIILESL
jgi:hypothetical protein